MCDTLNKPYTTPIYATRYKYDEATASEKFDGDEEIECKLISSTSTDKHYKCLSY